MRQFGVIGLGRFGSSVALTLRKLGYNVLGMDSSAERVQELSNELTHVVQADSTDEEALKTLGIRNFDVVVVAIGDDMNASIFTTLLLKELGVPNIVAKARNAIHGKMLEKIGADRVVYPERDMGARVAHNLVSPNVLDYIELSPNLGIVEVKAPQQLVGKNMEQSRLRADYGINVVAIKSGDDINVAPGADDLIKEHDILVVVGANSGIQKLEHMK